MQLPQPQPAPRPEPPWRELFAGSPRQILERLIDGDPLELAPRCHERLLRQALLMDVRRIYLRAVAHVARNAPSYRGDPSFEVWIADKVRRAVKEIAAEDENDQELPVAGAPGDPMLSAIAGMLGIEPLAFQRCCAAFNRAPFDVRTAFFGMVVERRSAVQWASENSVNAERAKILVRRALWILGVREELDLDELLETDGPDGGLT